MVSENSRLLTNKDVPIKVLHVVSGLVSGGVEQMLINYYSHMDRDRFQFDILYQHEPITACLRKFTDLGCNTYRIPSKREHPLRNFLETYRVIKRGHYDVVHAHMTLTNFIPLLGAKLCGVPTRISHSHATVEECNPFLAKLFRLLTRRFATDYFACGNDAAAFLYGQKICNSNKITIVRNAIDVDHFAFNDSMRVDERKKLGVSDRFVIGHIGRFTEQKNHKFLIDVFREIYHVKPNSVLILVGAGELRNEIKDKVAKSGLQDAVLFLEPRADVSSLYQAFDVFLLPSLYEGLSLTSIEAQTCGLPCLFSDRITKECKLTESVQFLPIDHDTTIWVQAVLNLCKTYVRKSNYEEIRQAGFDIVTQVYKMENFLKYVTYN